MKVEAITTCSAAGWEQYGRRMAGTWVQHWPVPLTVWAEGFVPDVDGVQVCSLDSVQWLADFKATHQRKNRGRYNFRLDAARFAHKTAAVIEHARSSSADFIVWCDADTVTHRPVPWPFVQSLLPAGPEYVAWLDRVGNYPECGFYVLNAGHQQHKALIDQWQRLYVGGGLFRLAEWHDSYVLQVLVERMFRVARKSLSGPVAAKTSHPFINGPLGAYMDHLKGGRKDAGRSHPTDLKTKRTEDYWK